MFSGIIQDLGVIERIEKKSGQDLRVRFKTALPFERLTQGASISCDGACMTLVEAEEIIAESACYFDIDISAASCAVTILGDWQTGKQVNLEPALRLMDGLDGHLVSGHVDAVAQLIDTQDIDGSVQMRFSAPQEFGKLLAYKGSVCLNGVSLTVNQVEDKADSNIDSTEFTCNIIPHTLKVTNLGQLQIGDALNLEVDLIARYLQRLLGAPAEQNKENKS